MIALFAICYGIAVLAMCVLWRDSRQTPVRRPVWGGRYERRRRHTDSL